MLHPRLPLSHQGPQQNQSFPMFSASTSHGNWFRFVAWLAHPAELELRSQVSAHLDFDLVPYVPKGSLHLVLFDVYSKECLLSEPLEHLKVLAGLLKGLQVRCKYVVGRDSLELGEKGATLGRKELLPWPSFWDCRRQDAERCHVRCWH